MFYRIIREFNDGCLYYCGGAAGEGTSWTDTSDRARHYRSADQTVKVGATLAPLVDAGRLGVEEIEELPVASMIWEDEGRAAPSA